ncbi:MAG: hypothetical protein C5B50_28340 [Verrucomicrobia bacterium]|nr:MAG: hypothetical protein C5B50_28340 [Verrucomicrobiota bacterium]
MKMLPTTKDERWSFVLALLGSYVIGLPVVAIVSQAVSEIAGWDKWMSYTMRKEEALRYYRLLWGYIACVLGMIFVFPFLPQKRLKRAALAFFVISLCFLVLLVIPLSVPSGKTR